MGLLNPGGPIAQFKRSDCSISPVEVISLSGVRSMMANGKLRSLRRETHYYFDQLHAKGLMSKQEAYLWMAAVLAVPLDQAHIGLLGEYYCRTVIDESKKILQTWERKQNSRAGAVLAPKISKVKHESGEILM